MAEKKINGRTFKVDHLPAKQAISLYAEIVQTVGSAINRLPQILVAISADEDSRELMADISAVGAIVDIIKSSSPAGVTDLVVRICEVAQIKRDNGDYFPVDFDADFMGKLSDIQAVSEFVIKEQFSDFFIASGASGLLGSLRKALAHSK